MRFVMGEIWQGTRDPAMRAEVIEVSDDGYSATLRLLTGDGGTFQLNRLSALIGEHLWCPLR